MLIMATDGHGACNHHIFHVIFVTITTLMVGDVYNSLRSSYFTAMVPSTISVDVAAELMKRMRDDDYNDADEYELRKAISEHLRISYIRHKTGRWYESAMTVVSIATKE